MDTIGQATQLALIITLLILTFWRKDTFLYLVTFPIIFGSGLMWYSSHRAPDGFLMSLGMVGIGVYCGIMGIYNLIKGRSS